MKNKLSKLLALSVIATLATPSFAAGTNMGQGTETFQSGTNTKDATRTAPEGHGAVVTDRANTNGNYNRDNIDPNRVLDRSTIPEQTTMDRNLTVPAETTTLTEHTPTKVKEVQRALDSRGFEVGSIDGIWGSQTRSALKEFQSSNGLEASGDLNDETYNALGITSERSMSLLVC